MRACVCVRPSEGCFSTGLAGMLFGAAALAAVQLLPGIDASRESVRSAGLSYADAAMFSFPPENLLTLLVPGFFGDIVHVPYWGRWYLWEMSLYVGAISLVLAVYGAFCGERPQRRFCVPMVLLLVLLAWGDYTPLFRFLYYCVPGFGKFRSISKFVFFAAVFLTMLAGVGMDRLIRRPCHGRRLAAIVAGIAVLLGLAAAAVHFAVAGPETAAWWRNLVHGMGATHQIYLRPEAYSDPGWVRHFGECAAVGTLIAAGTLLLLAGLLATMRRFHWTVYLIALLAVVEVFVFAAESRDTFELAAVRTPGLAEFLAAHPGDYRILNLSNPNEAMLLGAYDSWGGYDQTAAPALRRIDGLYPGAAASRPLCCLPRLPPLFRHAASALRVSGKKRGRTGVGILDGTAACATGAGLPRRHRARCDFCRHERSRL